MDYSLNSALEVDDINSLDDIPTVVNGRAYSSAPLSMPPLFNAGVSSKVGTVVRQALYQCLLGLGSNDVLPMGTVVKLGFMAGANRIPILMGMTPLKDFNKVVPGTTILYQFRDIATTEKQLKQVLECARLGFGIVIFVSEKSLEPQANIIDVVKHCSSALSCPDIINFLNVHDVSSFDWSSMYALSVWMTRVLTSAATPDVLAADLSGILSFQPEKEEATVENLKSSPKMYFSSTVINKVRKYVRALSGSNSGSKTGIIISGPPGTGKSMLPTYLAAETNRYLVSTSLADLQSRSPHLGQMLRSLREVFDEAREHAPSILFFDEFDSIGSRSSSVDNHYWNIVINAFLEHLQGISSRGDVAVIASTNHPECIDAALIRAGRMNGRLEMPLPSEIDIKQMLIGELPGLHERDIMIATSVLRGCNYADIATFCDETTNYAREADRSYVTSHDINMTIHENEPNCWQTTSTHGKLICAYALSAAYTVMSRSGGDDRISGIVLRSSLSGIPSLSPEISQSTLSGYMQDINAHAAILVALEKDKYDSTEDEIVFRMREHSAKELLKCVEKLSLLETWKITNISKEATKKTIISHAMTFAREILSEADNDIWLQARDLFREGYINLDGKDYPPTSN